MSDTPLTIYAELLSNIRQISVVASLPSPCRASTTLRLGEEHDGRHLFQLNHDDSRYEIRLPARVDRSATIQQPQPGKLELSWRFPIWTSTGLNEEPDSGYVSQGWSATSLTAGITLLCRECQEVIIAKDVIAEWKDLPSENWAEMMEFWHCHKPEDKPDDRASHTSGHGHDHHPKTDDQEKNTNRGYGANSRFAARTGVGFVDILTFLLAEGDCENIKVRTLFAIDISCPRMKVPPLYK